MVTIRKTCNITITTLIPEGDYTTWTALWNTAVTAIDVSRDYVLFNDESDVVCFVSKDKAYIMTLSTGALLSELDILYYGYASDLAVGSIQRKYLAIVDSSADTFKIYKDGVLKQTITPVPGDVICGVGMSYDGKYIVVGLRDADKIYCYKGA